jgi:carnitine-CoA ligase
VPSELTEEDIKAFVVPVPGHRVDLAELPAWVAARLAAFKVPRFWQVLDELPHTPTARVAKHRLPAGRQPDEYDAERPAPAERLTRAPAEPASADSAQT